MIASMFWNLKSDYSGIWGYQNVFNVNYVLPWYIDDLMIILGSYRLYLSMYLPVLPFQMVHVSFSMCRQLPTVCVDNKKDNPEFTARMCVDIYSNTNR